MSDAPDQAERDKALAAPGRTVLIDAGAGAGKTTLLVARILTLIAPLDDTAERVPLSRLAAMTFTRRAAGELRLRVRAGILTELANAGNSKLRTEHLLESLGSIDSSFIGTIHGFADRLLRLQPMKARLSPAYEIAEDIDVLVEETFDVLLHAVQSGTLAAELEGVESGYVLEVERTFQEALRAGVLVRSFERAPAPPKVGLDLLVRGFIEQRDRELTWTDTQAFDRVAFDASARSFVASVSGIVDEMRGTRWLLTLATRVSELLEEPDDLALYELVDRIKRGLKEIKKTKDFVKKSAALAAWNTFAGDEGFGRRLMDPLVAAMARNLARTRHAVVTLYEQVKQRRECLDSIDLLLSLRNLLRDDLDARGFYQRLFDHVLVDELQDTDPLQAEIVLFLSEATPVAARWQDVVVGAGRLTLVGDPKQSIYRFRRADVGMYDRMRAQVARGDHANVTLSANFRSVPSLIAWSNARFTQILGIDANRQFDPDTGQVFHQPQTSGLPASGDPPVHQLNIGFADGEARNAPEARALEGTAVAAYLSWLTERSGILIRDPDGDGLRPIRWSDIAVLALVTTNVRYLSEALDRSNIPHAMAGGVLFTTDPLHRQFVLGLRAIADRNDGVAEAALLRPPFFAVDLLDLVRDKCQAGDAHAKRGAAARAWLRETRSKRFSRTPGQTARALLDETGIGRAAALGPNGEQRLRHLREVCLQLELDSAGSGLDYDGITARLRDWIEHPINLDPPRPVGAEAIQVLTVHQAKGLEFPVVVLWDGMGQWRSHESPTPWRVDRDGTGWSMKTNDVAWEEPVGGNRIEQDRLYGDAERRRLVYVAATRARDLLIIPKPTWDQPSDSYIHAALLADPNPAWVHSAEPFIEGIGASWAAPPQPFAPITDTLDIELAARWSAARDESQRSRHAPRSVTGIAKATPMLRVGDAELPTKEHRPKRASRFGPVFGDVVHQAIGLVLTKQWPATRAVEATANALDLTEHREDAVKDVERAVASLVESNLVGGGCTTRLEYPIAVARDGQLVVGYIDFLSAFEANIVVIDFKTDQAVADALESYPEYARQLRAYAEVTRATRAGLLFTATGELAWLA
ncbi:MAG: UvrD-helicase domain-containing protein [Myxococcota bacterium]|nr:UvrD-helicase domain-containing protein [Myxococcota bacterium]